MVTTCKKQKDNEPCRSTVLLYPGPHRLSGPDGAWIIPKCESGTRQVQTVSMLIGVKGRGSARARVRMRAEKMTGIVPAHCWVEG